MTPRVKKEYEQRKAAGHCVKCGAKPKNGKLKRLACTACHSDFLNNKPAGKVAAAKYEARCMELGYIGPNQQGRRKQSDFRKISDRVTA